MAHMLLIASLILMHYSLIAQQQSVRFRRYSINDGLSQSSIKSIVQDETGFIWMASQDGLNRFDSQNFETWKRKKSHTSLTDNNINQIIHTENNIWIASQGGGINVFDTDADSIEWIESPSGKQINSLLHTSRGEVWAGGENEITVIDESNKKNRSDHQHLGSPARRRNEFSRRCKRKYLGCYT